MLDDIFFDKFTDDNELELNSKTYKILIINNNKNIPFVISFNGFCSHLINNQYIDNIDIQKLNEIPYFMYNIFKINKNYNYIFVVDKYQIWASLNFDFIFKSLKNIINHYIPNKIFCIGQSAGGYQSILFGNLLNVNKIISFVPQINIFTTNMCRFRNEIIKKYDLLNFKYKNLNILQPFNTITKIYVCNEKNDIIHLNNLDKYDKKLIIIKISEEGRHEIQDVMGKDKYIRLILDELCVDI